MAEAKWRWAHTTSKHSLAIIGIAVLSVGMARAAQSPQVPLPGSAIKQFVQPLPKLNLSPGTVKGGIAALFGNRALTLRMCEFRSAVLPPGTIAALPPGAQPLTWTWGYLVDPTGTSTCAQLIDLYKNPTTGAMESYLGPVLVNARNGDSTDITWVNDLGTAASTNVLAYKYGTDQTLHWADPANAQTDEDVNMCMMKGEMSMFWGPAGWQSYPPPGDVCAQNYDGPIPAAPHLHGGEQPAEIDGSPDSWWTSDGSNRGHKYYTFGSPAPNAAIYRYPNQQQAAPIWFHDHTLGATRLNVYAGLAGGYYIYDPEIIPVSAGGTCTASCLPANLQPLDQIIPLVLQDRMFDTSGQLFFPADDAGGVLWALNPEHPYWVPEFVGDTIVINGKAWPYTNVDRKRYRFLFLNGSNARTYEMFLVDPVTKVMGPPMWVIGTDGGYLDTPVKIDPNAKPLNRLVIQPGERYEVIIDFGDPTWLALNPNFSGSLVLKNTGRTPYPKGAAPQGTTLGQMMKFVVSPGAVADTGYDPASGTPLRTGSYKIERLVNPATGTLTVTPAKTRAVTLNEIARMMAITAIDPVTGLTTTYPGGPLEILVNNTKWAGKSPLAPDWRPDFTTVPFNGITTSFSELPREGDIEVWEIINTTADAHPIHLHLVQFQVLNRQAYNTNNYLKAYAAAFGTNPNVPLLPGCAAGVFCPAYGPPLDYAPSTASGGKYGGNPDVAPFLQGPVQPPLPSEAGWKDTAINMPGMVTRYAVRWAPNALPIGTPAAQLAFPFDPSGEGHYNYVWHCHIIDHEDNEMMRPDLVTLNPDAPAPADRPLVKGVDY